MNKIFSRKYSSDRYAFIAVILFLIYAFYYSLLEKKYIIQIMLILFSIVFGFMSIVSETKTLNIQKRLLKFMTGWLLIILIILFFKNWWGLTGTIRWLWSIFIVFCVCQNNRRLTGIYKAVIIIGLPHVLATLFFFFFRNLYPVMYKIFGFWPSGTRDGRLGFKAGISNHYSLNGIYIAIVFLCCFAYTFYLYKKHKKNIIIFGLISMIVFFSLVLTMKRAHLLFSVSAIFLSVIIYAPKISARQLMNVIVILLVISGFFLWAYQKFPEIGMALQRFESIDADDYGLSQRFEMWNYALRLFSEHPLIGIGWGGFKASSGFGMNAHNVYLQLLAETGIFGFSIYAITIIILFVNSIRGSRIIVKSSCYNEFYFSSFTSLLILFFYIFYSFSGNCLYDVTFRFFIFTIATTYYLFQPKVREGSSSVNGSIIINNDGNIVQHMTL